MKRIFVVSPLRGTPMQFKMIDDRVRMLENTGAADEITRKAVAAWRAELFEANQRLAERLCREVILAGNRPVAGHLFYPRFLDDKVQSERELGMKAGREDLIECQVAWIYTVYGISVGMSADIQAARDHNILLYTPEHWAASER